MREDELVAERVRGLLDRHSGVADLDVDVDVDVGVDLDDDDVDRRDDGSFEADPFGADHSDDEVSPAVRARRPAPSLLSRLAARVPVRLDPGHRAAIAVGLAVLVAAVITGAWLLAAKPRSLAVDKPAPISGAVSPEGSAAPQAEQSGYPAGGTPPVVAGAAPPDSSAGAVAEGSAEVVVDVAGKVLHPGLYHLDSDARVADALAAAGGPRRGVDLTSVNLAAKVVDGQQIVIGRPGGAASPGQVTEAADPGAAAPAAAPASAASAASAPVDLNTATLEQLESLPGIGPALGQRILDWRTAHGSFSGIDQLKDVSGIGDVRFADLMPLVTV